MNTLEFLQRAPISAELREALLPAIAKAGPMKGYLLSNPPADNTAWQILIGYVAPARFKISGMMFGNAKEYSALDQLCRDAKFNWPQILTAIEPYARWNADPVDVDKVLAQIEPFLKPAPAPEPKKRAHRCVEELDAVADMIAAGNRELVDLIPLTGKKGAKLIGVMLTWNGTKMRVVMDDNVQAVRARADRLDRQIKGHKAASVTKGFKEARRARNWKPSNRVVPLSPERAAECGMETI